MGVAENELYDAVMRDLVDLQRKKGHIPFWGSLGNREEDQDVAEIEVARCWAKEMNKRGWQIDLDTIRPNPKDPPDCLAEMDGGKTIGVEVSMLVHPQARFYWKLLQSDRGLPPIKEPGLHDLDQWREKPRSPNTYEWPPKKLQKALSNIVKNKNEKIENKRAKDSSVLSHLSKLFLVIPMDEAQLDGTLGEDKYWAVEDQIIEVPRPRSIDGVYVLGPPDWLDGTLGDGNDHYLVSEVRLAE